VTAIAAPSLAERLALRGVVPVVAVESAREGVQLAAALAAGGLPVIEVTFRTAAAAAAIAAITNELPDVLVGAGTLLRLADVSAAVDAGAHFGVAPGLNPEVVAAALGAALPFIPGVATASEVERGFGFGLDLFKLFPAEPSGGIALLKALAGPYPTARFMPTGGIGPDNVGEYLALDNVVACGGSWLASRSLLDAHDYAEITRRAAVAAGAAIEHSTWKDESR